MGLNLARREANKYQGQLVAPVCGNQAIWPARYHRKYYHRKGKPIFHVCLSTFKGIMSPNATASVLAFKKTFLEWN